MIVVAVLAALALVADAPTPATVAAQPPALQADAGAPLPFVEYEAENGVTNGELIGPDRTFGMLAAEASGRRAVRLNRPGDFVEFVLARPADAVVLRYALPDSADGRGLDGEITIQADGERLGALALTSRYGWFYGRYPFSNRPADGRGHHGFDDARLKLPRLLPAGTHVRFVVEHADAAAWRVLDLADFERVGEPLPRPKNALSVLAFGADPTGRRDASDAVERALARGRKTHRPVWLDPGTYRVTRHLIVDHVTLAGAGPWYSVLSGPGVGVYGRDAKDGGSEAVTLRDFAIFGQVTDRQDHVQVNGVGGAMSRSEIANLWIQHTKVGLWFDGPMSQIAVRNLRLLDLTADGLNFHRGVTDAVVEDSFVRGSGDDGLASWSHRIENARITFRHNTVVAPVLANGIAAYGGRDITIADNLVADTLTEGGGLHLGARFDATPFAGRIAVTGNQVLRSGAWDERWKTGVGALWLYALDRPIGADIRVEDNRLADSSFEALQLMGKPIEGVTVRRLQIDGAAHALQLQAPGRGDFESVKARDLRGAGVNDCGSGFRVVRLGGNSGWDSVACSTR